MSWCSDAPEDEAISLFAGLLANPDMRLSLPSILIFYYSVANKQQQIQQIVETVSSLSLIGVCYQVQNP